MSFRIFYPAGIVPVVLGTGPTGATGVNINRTGYTGVTGISSNTGITGVTGYTGYSANTTGPTGGIGISITGYTGPNGISIGPTGRTGPIGSVSNSMGVTGSIGRNGVDNTGPTGAGNNLGITGPVGAVSGTGPTGSTGISGNSVLPSPLLSASCSLVSTSITPNNESNVAGNLVYNSSSYYIIWGGNSPNSAMFGVPQGLWKIVFSVNWGAGTTNGYRQLSIIDNNSETVYGQNIEEGDTSSTAQQLTWIGNLDGNTLRFEVLHNDPSSVNITGGFISLYSYTQGTPNSHTGGSSPAIPGQYEFAVKMINHDIDNPPVQLAIIYNNDASTSSYYYSVNGSNSVHPTPGNAIGATGPIAPLFVFDWNSLPVADDDENARVFLLGTDNSGNPIELNSLRIYIAKTDVFNNQSNYSLWTADGNGLAGGIPQTYLESYTASQMTIDFIEITYNKPVGQYTIFANTTQVDGMNIPTTLTLSYKVVDGNRRANSGPVGISANMTTILNTYKPMATGSVFWGTIVPIGNPCRLSAIDKLISPPSGSESYYNSYINSVWTSLNTGSGGTSITFHGIGEATFDTATIYTDDLNMYVTTSGGSSPYPSSLGYSISKSLVLDHTLDLFGNAGVWADPAGETGNNAAVVLKTKAYLVATFCRGVISLQDNFTGGTSGTPPYPNSVWNDWLAQGANFYINSPSFVYPRLIHNFSINATTSQGTRPYAYGISFDDVYLWSTTLTSNQITGDTQAGILNIDIYKN